MEEVCAKQSIFPRALLSRLVVIIMIPLWTGIIQKAISSPDSILVLRSKSFNTISQFELIEEHQDIVMEYARGMKPLDLAIEITKTNITSLATEYSPLTLTAQDAIQIQGCSLGKIEKLTYQAILTNDTFYLKTPFKSQGNFKLRIEALSSYQEFCVSQSPKQTNVSCSFLSFLHTGLERLDHFLLETLRVATILDAQGKVVETIETTLLTSFFLKSPVLDTSVPMWPKTVMMTASFFKILVENQETIVKCNYSTFSSTPKLYTQLLDDHHIAELYFLKWCSPDGHKPPDVRSTPVDVFQVSLRTKSTQAPSNITYLGKIESYLEIGGINLHQSLKLLAFVRSGLHTVFVNQDRIVSISTSNFLEFVSKLSPSSATIQLRLLQAISSVSAYCNKVTSAESSCVSWQYPENPTKEVYYQVFEILCLETNVVVLTLPIFVQTDEAHIEQVVVTKNYLLFQADRQLYACYKKLRFIIKLRSSEGFKDACTHLDLLQSAQSVELVVPLLLEENQSNDIDGYITVALKETTKPEEDKNGVEEVYIKSFLVTGPYFTFKIDTNLGNSVCARYFSDCDSTSLSFTTPNQVQKSQEKEQIMKQVYVLGGTFSSVLERPNGKQVTSIKNPGMYKFPLSSYFFGDVITPRFSKSIGFSYEKHLTASTNADYYASLSQSFTYSFPDILDPKIFLPIAGQDPPFKVHWVFIKYNSDNTFLFALSYEHLEEDIAYLKTAKMNYSVELHSTSTTLDSTFFTQFITAAKSTYKNLIPLHNTDKDSVDLIKVDRHTYFGEWVVSAMQYYKDKISEDPKLGTLKIQPLPNEQFQTVRTRVSGKDDLFAIITDQGVYICKFAQDLTREIKLVSTVYLDDLIDNEYVPYYEIEDILLEDNILLLDIEVYDMTISDYTNRIFIYNLDSSEGTIYMYGYIKIPLDVVRSGYMVYYSKSVDKLILVQFGKARTVVEYSLDNIFLDSNKLGKEITNDTWSFVDNYRDLKVESFLPVAPQSTPDSYQNTRTLSASNQDGYLIVANALNVTTNIKTVLILLGQINEMVLSVFKSELVEYDPNTIIILPESIADRIEIPYLPLVMINRKTGACNLVFFWRENFVEMHYRRIFDTGHNQNASQQSDTEVLMLEFNDPSGKHYVESFSIEKEGKFGIHPQMTVKDNEVLVDSEETGPTRKIGIECGDKNKETVGKILRNLSASAVCQQEDRSYNLTISNTISKTSILYLDSSWKEVRDLVRLKSPHSNIFVILESKRILVVKSYLDTLKQVFNIKSGTVDIDFAECAAIRNAQQYELTVEISVLCNSKEGTKEHLYSFKASDLNQAERFNTTKTFPDSFPLKSFSLPEKIWITVASAKKDVIFTDELVFVKNQIFWSSVGEKYVLDLYYFNTNAKTPDTRYTLVNTLFYDKYSDFELLTFQAMKFSFPTRQPQFSLIQLFGAKHSTTLRVNYQTIKVNNMTNMEIQAPRILNLDTKNNRGEEATVLHAEVFSEISAEVADNYKNITHTFYVVLEDSAFEISLTESNTKFGTSVLFNNKQQILDSVVYYNYGALCESGVEFRLRHTREYLLLNCMPTTFDSSSNSLMIFKRDKMNRQKAYVNPLFTLPQLIGYTPKNSIQEIFRGEDNKWRIIKSSPRGLMEQFTIQGSPKVVVSLEKGDLKKKVFQLHFFNNYEVEFVQQSVNERGWHDVGWIADGFPTDPAGWIILSFYLTSLIIWLNILNIKWCFRKICKKKKPTRGSQVMVFNVSSIEAEFESKETSKEVGMEALKQSFFVEETPRQTRKQRQMTQRPTHLQDLTSSLLNDLVF